MADLRFIFLDSAALLMLNYQHIYLFGRVQTSQTGGQPYSDNSPYGECSLLAWAACLFSHCTSPKMFWSQLHMAFANPT